VVSTPRKLVLLAAAWTQAPWVRTAEQEPAPLAAIDYLVQGCRQAQVQPPQAGTYFPNRAMPQRVAWVIDLLERRENARRQRSRPMMHSQSA
jgi:phytoene synthase